MRKAKRIADRASKTKLSVSEEIFLATTARIIADIIIKEEGLIDNIPIQSELKNQKRHFKTREKK